jgi:transcriptional regulator with XRE-family HTH domain
MPKKNIRGVAMYEIYERLINELGLTTYRVAMDTGIAQSVFSAWKSGKSKPKPDKLKKIADRLHVSVDYLMGDVQTNEQAKYYVDDEVAEIAQAIFVDPNLRALFDAAADSKPKDLQMAAELLKRFKETNSDQ